MNKILLAFFIAILCFNAKAQTPLITTYAGGGVGNAANGVPAINVSLQDVKAVVTDAAGNVYFSNSYLIYKVNTSGILSVVLNITQAQQNGYQQIGGLAIDASGSVYFSLTGGRMVKKITAAGVITTVAGTGAYGKTGDGGNATSALLANPQALAIDKSDNLYIADKDYNIIRKVTKAGIISLFAGGGGATFENVPATQAALNPTALAAGADGNIYVAGQNGVQKIVSGGNIFFVANASSYVSANAFGLAVDAAGTVFISDYGASRIVKILANGATTLITNQGNSGVFGDDVPAAQFNTFSPYGLALNSKGELFVADISNQRIRKIYTPPAPTITSFTPAKAAYGKNITITGTNFKGTTSVTFGGNNATPFTIGADFKTITTTVPVLSALTNNVQVTTYGGTATKAGFTYIPQPTITSLSTKTGPKGTVITIKGTNFSADAKVTFGGVPAASVRYVSATTVTATVGEGASGAIILTNAGGTAIYNGFTYTGAIITDFQPRKAKTGTTVVISGKNFTGATAVSFGGVAAKSFKIVSSAQITAVVNTGKTGLVKVTVPKGAGSSIDTFTYVPPPTIKSFTPNAGAAGATITITGTGFDDVQSVSFGGTAATSFTVLSPTKISAEVAYGASGSISVTTPGGTATLAGFTYVKPLDLSMNNVAFCPSVNTKYPASVDVTVTVKNFKDLASLQGSFGWDNSILQYSSIVNYGPVSMGITAANFNKTSENRLTFVWHDVTTKGVTLSDNTVLFKIRFSIAALTENAGVANVQFLQDPLPFEASHKVLNLVPVVTHDGQVTVPAGAIIQPVTTNVCAGESVNLTVNAPGKYQWYKNDVAITTAKSATYAAKASGNYKVIITTSGGCLVVSDVVKVVVNPIPPAPKITSNSPLLLGDTLKATASTVANASNYIWTTPTGNTYYGQKLIIPNADSYMSGPYSVVAVVNGCNSLPATANIIVNNTLAISGRIYTPLNKPVPYVYVTLAGTTNVTKRTGVQGDFKFPLATGGNFILTPAKDNDKQKTNGITALDITFIQAHLLQKTLFDSPYKLIAADANNSGTVSALDLVHIRRMILGIDTTFPGKRMWAFVNSNNTPYYYNPFPFVSNRTYESLNSSVNSQDFIGVKIGDVTYDWNPKIMIGEPDESNLINLSSNHVGLNATSTNIELYHNDVNAYNKTDVVIPVKVKNFKQLLALQYTLSWNKSKLEYKGISKNTLGIEFTDFHKAKGILTAIWNDPGNNAKTLSDGTVLFELILRRKPGALLDNEGIKVTSDVTLSVAYDNTYAERKIIKGSGIITDKKGTTADQDQPSDFKVSPNPSNGDVKIYLHAKVARPITIWLVNVLGKTVYMQKQNVNIGDTVIPVDLRKFRSKQAPNYFIQIGGLEKTLVKQLMLNGDNGAN
ncbi:hypothetical protein FFF34_000540 [Inquilinus sp. KBS0705]|nr:hypothetical protein FFF34_000540 [Inquilinus sp. KBS0705]